MRKNTTFIIFLMVLICLASLFSACGKKEAEIPETTDTVEIAPVESTQEIHTTKYKDGIYTAGRKGYGGNVIVTATIANDEILDIQIEGEEETKGVGSVAIERMPARLMEAQSPEVDGVSGATETSNAIKAALEDILRKAEY